MKHFTYIIMIVVIWRVLLGVPLWIGYRYLPFRPNSVFTTIWSAISPYAPVNNFLLYPWANFDGVHYLAIAGQGYTTNLRFFPLFPLLIRSVALLFGGGNAFSLIQFLSGIAVANGSFVVALYIFYLLIKLDYTDQVARSSIISLLLFPTSFFFGSIYSESAFLLLSLLAFYWARKRNWVAASLAGMLLSATRIVGIGILVSLVYEFWLQEKHTMPALKKGAILGLVPLGLIGFGIFNWIHWQNPLYFMTAQGQLNNGRSVSTVIFPLQTIFRYGKILTYVSPEQYEWWIALLELLFFGVSDWLLLLGWKHNIRRSYLIFALFCWLVPLLTGTLTGLPRYVLVMFPLYISLATLTHQSLRIITTIVSAGLLILLFVLFSRGYFVA